MPYAITTTVHFPAAHQLRLYDGTLEELHDHLWQVKVTVASESLDSIGVVMDFHELTRLLEAVLLPWRNRRLNDVPPFIELNPSAENVAGQIASLLKVPASVRLTSVEVWETPENSAVFQP
jgi:6-pyruvoyltetrahydropterin/6-carboxytetrahydropterin synthase